jgi:hypothetical protein
MRCKAIEHILRSRRCKRAIEEFVASHSGVERCQQLCSMCGLPSILVGGHTVLRERGFEGEFTGCHELGLDNCWLLASPQRTGLAPRMQAIGHTAKPYRRRIGTHGHSHFLSPSAPCLRPSPVLSGVFPRLLIEPHFILCQHPSTSTPHPSTATNSLCDYS